MLIPDAHCKLPTEYGLVDCYVFSDQNGDEHVAIVRGIGEGRMDVRIHSECITSEVFGSTRCDCAKQLHGTQEHFRKQKSGILIYLRQEGRGIGLTEKIKAYDLQIREGIDTVDANRKLGHADDLRNYAIAIEILRFLKVETVSLITNNPLKVQALTDAGLDVIRKEMKIRTTGIARDYVQTKVDKMSHYPSEE